MATKSLVTRVLNYLHKQKPGIPGFTAGEIFEACEEAGEIQPKGPNHITSYLTQALNRKNPEVIRFKDKVLKKYIYILPEHFRY